MAQRPQLSLESDTRVRQSGTIFAGPLANDLQKIVRFINAVEARVESLEVTVPDETPVSPASISDFMLPAASEWRDDGAMDVAIEALCLASVSRAAIAPPQIVFCTQSTFPVLSGVAANTMIAVTDYAHLIYWDGSISSFLDGGNCFIALFDIDPGSGWHLLDGAVNVPYLKADGTLGAYTVEDATIAFFLEAGMANSGPTAASAPTFTGTPVAPAGTNSAPTFTGTPKTWDVVNVVSAAGTQSVLKDDATNNPYTPAGSVSAPIFTGSPLTPAGTVSATGEPRRLVRRAYFRQ